MTTVVTTESVQNAKELCRIFENFGGAFFLSKDSVLDFSAVPPEFLVFCTDNIREIPAEKTILLSDGSASLPRVVPSNRFDRILVFEPTENIETTENMLSVGLSRHSTISIASAESNMLHISVQSIVRTLDGAQILPCEYSVTLSRPFDSRTALYAFSVLLLCGKTDAKSLKLRL